MLLVLLLFLLALARSMVAHGATCDRAEHRMMTGIMAGDTANRRPLDAAFCKSGSGSGREQDQGQEKRSGKLHGDHLKGLSARSTLKPAISFPSPAPSGASSKRTAAADKRL
jgi:hypothetical protein